jgi:leucyl-tRNA synthetase
LGKSAIAYIGPDQKMYSYDCLPKDQNGFREVRILIDLINDDESIQLEALQQWQPQYENLEFVKNDAGKVIVKREVDKMSKRWYNVVTPDDLCERYGADTLRMYEMFLGPLEQSKPWDTKGITGVHGFLKKYWRLFHQNGTFEVSEGEASPAALKTLHKTIKKLRDDLERFSFNTGVSSFMICVNELTDQKCNNRHILEQLTILMAPYAPHICEEIWSQLQPQSPTIFNESYPELNEAYLTESSFSYPVSFNGKMRMKVELPLNLSPAEIEAAVMALPDAQKWLEGKTPKKVIIVPGKIVNIVL